MTETPPHNPPLPHLLVTAASDNYFWGVLLLAGSLRMHGCDLPLLLLSLHISTPHIEILRRFHNLIIVDADTQQILADSLDVHPDLTPPRQTAPPPRNNSPLFKPMAMMLAFELAETVTWVDADCMAWGNITPLLMEEFQGIRIRERGATENREVFIGRYAADDIPGEIPRATLSTWKSDVNSLQTPRLDRQVVTNCFSLQRENKHLLEAWADLMRRVGVTQSDGVVHNANPAYFMTDESTLTALLAFDPGAPDLSSYNLEDPRGPHLIHFGRHPKPWKAWQYRHFRGSYSKTQAVIRWLRDNQIAPDHAPWPLNPRLKPIHLLQAGSHEAARWLKRSLARS